MYIFWRFHDFSEGNIILLYKCISLSCNNVVRRITEAVTMRLTKATPYIHQNYRIPTYDIGTCLTLISALHDKKWTLGTLQEL